MAGRPIRCRIDLAVTVSSKDADRCLGWIVTPSPPVVGELVNVNGDPFHVVDRGWAVQTMRCPDEAVAARQPVYCYLRVVGRAK